MQIIHYQPLSIIHSLSIIQYNNYQPTEAAARRSSVKKVFLEISQKEEGHLSIKIASLRPSTLLKKRLWHRCFPVNFVKFLRTPFLTQHLRWLLLNQCNAKLLPPLSKHAIQIWLENYQTKHFWKLYTVLMICKKQQAWSLELLNKERLWHRCFGVKFAKFFRAVFWLNSCILSIIFLE